MATKIRMRKYPELRVHQGEPYGGQPQGQWCDAQRAGGAGYAAALRAAQRSRTQRREVRLWARPVRRLHGVAGRQAGALVCHPDRLARPIRGHNAGGPRYGGQAASAAASLHGRAGGPMRLLHQRHDRVGEGTARPESASHGSAGARRPLRQSVPLRHPWPHHPRGAQGQPSEWEDMMSANISRREFASGLGGIVVAFILAPKLSLSQQPATLPGSLNGNRMLDAWIRIAADGSATVCTGKVELGQGILTALAQIAAEELNLPLARLHMISGDTEKTPNEGITSGSQSIENGGVALRLAGAEVRGILVDLAAKRLGAEASALTVADGVISAADGRKVTYGELARDADLHREVTAKVKPKSPSAHGIVGKSIARFDIPAKVTGGLAYVQDLRLPGMLHGRVVRPPSYGAKLEAIDEAKIKAMPGVVATVRDGSFLGVIAEREEQAIRASEVVRQTAKWAAGPPLPDQASLYDHLLSLPAEPHVISEKQAALPDGDKVVAATSRKPYMCHASIGPSCAVAQFTSGKMTVWNHSQGVFPLRGNLVKALNLPVDKVHCIHVEGSGCYGHNGADDVALDAALLVRGAPNGRPV